MTWQRGFSDINRFRVIGGSLVSLVVDGHPAHILFPFGREPIIFDTLLFVREACQVRGLEVGGPCLAERGLGMVTHL